jgi:hypothetical protein
MSACLLATLCVVAGCASGPSAIPAGATAAKPLFRDPVYDGAADPTLVWNAGRGRW